MLQAGDGEGEAALPATISELDPARWTKGQVVAHEQVLEGDQCQREMYTQLPGKNAKW